MALGKMLVRKNAGSMHRTMWWNQAVDKGHRGAIHCVGLGMIAKYFPFSFFTGGVVRIIKIDDGHLHLNVRNTTNDF